MSIQLNLIYQHIQSSYKFKQKISIHLLQAFNLYIIQCSSHYQDWTITKKNID